MTTEVVWLFLVLVVGVAFAAVFYWLRQLKILNEQLQNKDREVRHLLETNSDLRAGLVENQTALSQLKSHADDRLLEVQKAQQRLSETFASLSAESLQKNNEAFLTLAKTAFEGWRIESQMDLGKRQEAISGLVTPLYESLNKVDTHVRELEQKRQGAYEGLKQQISSLIDAQQRLSAETQNLSKALHAPSSRGRWGEMQLRRVVELAGMVAHCDFEEQVHVAADGENVRPDMVVRLPGSKSIVVDAKVPLTAFLAALDAKDEPSRLGLLKEHAEQVRKHIQLLSKKDYYKYFSPSPEFVILFLPGETFFSSALAIRPDLIEWGAENGVIVATPTTLIALLKAVAYGWRQEALQDNAQQISALAAQLCERIEKLDSHFNKLGRSLRSSVDAYNQTLGTMESRVYATGKKLRDLGKLETKSDKDVAEPIERVPRLLHLGNNDLSGSSETSSIAPE